MSVIHFNQAGVDKHQPGSAGCWCSRDSQVLQENIPLGVGMLVLGSVSCCWQALGAAAGVHSWNSRCILLQLSLQIDLQKLPVLHAGIWDIQEVSRAPIWLGKDGWKGVWQENPVWKSQITPRVGGTISFVLIVDSEVDISLFRTTEGGEINVDLWPPLWLLGPVFFHTNRQHFRLFLSALTVVLFWLEAVILRGHWV